MADQRQDDLYRRFQLPFEILTGAAMRASAGRPGKQEKLSLARVVRDATESYIANQAP
jgi:hypothetical protein